MSQIIKTPTTETQKRDAEQAQYLSEEFSSVRNSISAEENARKSADTTLQNSISAEENARKAADKTLNENLAAEIQNRQSAITDEENARKSADKILTDNLNSEIQNRQSAITDEENARKAADKILNDNLNSEIQNRQSAVTDEENARKAADKTLTDNLNSEIQNRQSAITDEENARKAADKTLTDNLADEVQARTNGDSTLTSSLNTLSGTVSGHTTSINSLNTTVGSHTTSINTLNSTVGSHTTSINSLNSTVGSHTTSINSLNSTVGSHTSTINSHTSSISSLRADVDDLKENGGGGTADTSQIEADIADIESDIAGLKNSLQTTNQSVSSLTNSLNSEKGKITTLQSNVSTLQNDLNTETAARIAGDNAVQNSLNTEIQNRKDAVTSLSNTLSNSIDSKTDAALTSANQYTDNKIDELSTLINNYIENHPDAGITSVAKPVWDGANSQTYTGSNITFKVKNYNSTYMTVSGTLIKKTVGTYTVTYTLKDTSTTQWNDGTTDPVTLTFYITKKLYYAPTVAATSFEYDGAAHSLTFTTSYDSTKMTIGGDTSKTEPGTYTTTLTLKDTTNTGWSGTTDATISYEWKILGRSIPVPTITVLEPKIVDTFPTFSFKVNSDYLDRMTVTIPDTQGYDVFVLSEGIYYTPNMWIRTPDYCFNDNHEVNPNYSKLTFALKDTASDMWDDGTTDAKVVTINLQPLLLDITTLVQDKTLTYTGSQKRVRDAFEWYTTHTRFNWFFKDTVDSDAVGTDAGTYTKTFTPRNYIRWADNTYAAKEVSITISPADWSFTVTDENGKQYVCNTADGIEKYYGDELPVTPKKKYYTYTVTDTCGGGTLGQHSSYIIFQNVSNTGFEAHGAAKNFYSYVYMTPPNSNYKTSNMKFYPNQKGYATLEALSWKEIGEKAYQDKLLEEGVAPGHTVTVKLQGYTDFGGCQVNNLYAMFLGIGQVDCLKKSDSPYAVYDSCAVFMLVQAYKPSDWIVPLHPPDDVSGLTEEQKKCWKLRNNTYPDFESLVHNSSALGDYCCFVRPMSANAGYYQAITAEKLEDLEKLNLDFFANGNYPAIYKYATNPNTVIDVWAAGTVSSDENLYKFTRLLHGEKNNWTFSPAIYTYPDDYQEQLFGRLFIFGVCYNPNS